MSYRGPDNNLNQYLRGLEDKISALQKSVGQARQNTVRLGDWVIEAEDDKKLKMTNLNTGQVTYVGDQYIPFVSSQEWSWAGQVTSDVDVLAPKWTCPFEVHLTHVVVTLQTASSSDYQISTYVGTGNLIDTVTLKAGLTKTIKQINMDLPAEQDLYPFIPATTGDGTELAVTYWYTGVYYGEI